MTLTIRTEGPGDAAAIRRLNTAAFGGEVEADLVDRLRTACGDCLSLVAVDEGTLVGHILFSPVSLHGPGVSLQGMGLGPMAVLPERQHAGIGTRLVRHGLKSLREAGCPFVVVLGHPAYYPRFGFEPASRHGIRCQWQGVPDEAFLVMPLRAEAMPAEQTVAHYRDEFSEAVD